MQKPNGGRLALIYCLLAVLILSVACGSPQNGKELGTVPQKEAVNVSEGVQLPEPDSSLPLWFPIEGVGMATVHISKWGRPMITIAPAYPHRQPTNTYSLTKYIDGMAEEDAAVYLAHWSVAEAEQREYTAEPQIVNWRMFYEYVGEEQQAQMDAFKGCQGRDIYTSRRQLLIILGVLPENTPRVTLQDAQDAISWSVDQTKGEPTPYAVLDKLMSITPYDEARFWYSPDAEFDWGNHSIYFSLDDGHTEQIIITEKHIAYKNHNTGEYIVLAEF